MCIKFDRKYASAFYLIHLCVFSQHFYHQCHFLISIIKTIISEPFCREINPGPRLWMIHVLGCKANTFLSKIFSFRIRSSLVRVITVFSLAAINRFMYINNNSYTKKNWSFSKRVPSSGISKVEVAPKPNNSNTSITRTFSRPFDFDLSTLHCIINHLCYSHIIKHGRISMSFELFNLKLLISRPFFGPLIRSLNWKIFFSDG